MTCLDRETAITYLSGDLEPTEAERLARHLAECSSCQTLIEATSGLIDSVRQDLLLVDLPWPEGERPPVESILRPTTSAAAQPLRRPQPPVLQLTARLKAKASHLEAWSQSWLRPRGWWVHASIVLALTLTLSGLFYFNNRQRVSADELLRRAERATVNARTVPNRIIRRVWKEKLQNGLGPLPDGEYRYEYWWDNARNQFAYVRYDQNHVLRQANWLLPDGRTYVFSAYGSGVPQLTIGPSDQMVFEAIEQLPAEVRETVRSYFQHSRRPLVETAADLVASVGQSVADSLAGQRMNATARETIGPKGHKAYLVTSRSEPAAAEAKVRRWEVDRLILDNSYAIIQERSRGLRRDGLIYEIDRELLDEQSLLPVEQNLPIFTPGPFPPNTEVRHVSAQERAALLRRRAGVPAPGK